MKLIIRYRHVIAGPLPTSNACLRGPVHNFQLKFLKYQLLCFFSLGGAWIQMRDFCRRDAPKTDTTAPNRIKPISLLYYLSWRFFFVRTQSASSSCGRARTPHQPRRVQSSGSARTDLVIAAGKKLISSVRRNALRWKRHESKTAAKCKTL